MLKGGHLHGATARATGRRKRTVGCQLFQLSVCGFCIPRIGRVPWMFCMFFVVGILTRVHNVWFSLGQQRVNPHTNTAFMVLI